MAMKGKRAWAALTTILIVAGSAFGYAPRPAAFSLCASTPPRETAFANGDSIAVVGCVAESYTNLIDGMFAGTYVWTPGGSATNITWTVAGVPCLTLQSGWNEALGVRTNMVYFVNGVPLASFAFSRGPGTNQITKITREDGSTRAVTYDNSGRLAGWKYRNAAGVADYDRSWLYSYDGAGNLLSSGHDPSVAGGPAPMSPMAKDYATRNIRTTSQFDIDEFNFNAVRRWNAVDLVCYAASNARVTVNGMPARQNGTRFVVSIPLAPSTTASVTNLTVCAVLDGGTNAEYYYTNTVQLTLPAYPETIETALASAVTSDSVMEYLYDARNQLRRITDRIGATAIRLQCTFDYYPNGRRARKTVTIWDGSAWQPYRICQYIYDRWNLIRELVTENGITTTRDYTWGLDLAGIQDGQWGQDAGGIGGLLAVTEVTTKNQEPGTTNIFLPICDHVGTVHALVAAVTNNVTLATPAIVATYEYTPYGELIAQDGPYANSCPFLFHSRYRDSETGNYCYPMRYYDPRSCKWMTVDPIGEDGGLNGTEFCGGDPVNSVDPDGLAPDADGIWDQVARPGLFIIGFGQGAWSQFSGIGSLIRHPIDTAKGIGSAVWNYKETYGAIEKMVNEELDASQVSYADRVMLEGRVTADVAGMFVGTGELGTLAKGGRMASALNKARALIKARITASRGAQLTDMAARNALMVRQREEAMRIYTQIIKDGNAAHLRALESEKIRSQQWFSQMTFVNPTSAKSELGVKYIGKLDDLKGIPRSQTLLDDLPDLGSTKANYYQNSSVLRKVLRYGYEIRDASAYRPNWSPDPTLLRPDRTVGQSFLGAERLILDNKGFVLDPVGPYVPR